MSDMRLESVASQNLRLTLCMRVCSVHKASLGLGLGSAH